MVVEISVATSSVLLGALEVVQLVMPPTPVISQLPAAAGATAWARPVTVAVKFSG